MKCQLAKRPGSCGKKIRTKYKFRKNFARMKQVLMTVRCQAIRELVGAILKIIIFLITKDVSSKWVP